MTDVAPVFIVGAPRSGTTMLAAMIGSHPAYAIGPESQFFSKLTTQDLAAATSDPEWPALAVQKLAGLTLAGQSVISLFETSESAMADYLKSCAPSVAAMLEALCVPFAQSRGRPGWAEKTPNHILSVDEIRRHWPSARIVRIMRDPRDAALSTCKLPTFSNSFAANIYLWRQWQDAAAQFFQTDPLACTIQYERLVTHPEEELQRLCTFIGVDFTPAMLNFSGTAADVSSAAETWKKPVAGKLDPSRLYAWKNVLGDADRILANNVTHEYLAAFDYDREPPVPQSRKAYRLSSDFVEQYELVLRRYLEGGTRWLPEANSGNADCLLEHPPYWQFRNPLKIARLAIDRLRFRLGWGIG